MGGGSLDITKNDGGGDGFPPLSLVYCETCSGFLGRSRRGKSGDVDRGHENGWVGSRDEDWKRKSGDIVLDSLHHHHRLFFFWRGERGEGEDHLRFERVGGFFADHQEGRGFGGAICHCAPVGDAD